MGNGKQIRLTFSVAAILLRYPEIRLRFNCWWMREIGSSRVVTPPTGVTVAQSMWVTVYVIQC